MPRLLKKVLTTDFRKMGDVNGDGVIDDKDADIFMKSFPSKKGDPNYNPACDFNRNGEVDINDLLTLVNNYGLTYEEWTQKPSILPLVAFLFISFTLMAL